MVEDVLLDHAVAVGQRLVADSRGTADLALRYAAYPGDAGVSVRSAGVEGDSVVVQAQEVVGRGDQLPLPDNLSDAIV